MRPYSLLCSALCMLSIVVSSCDSAPENRQFKPIVMGDSSTIVTELDSNYLSNNVADVTFGNTMNSNVDASATAPAPSETTPPIATSTAETTTPPAVTTAAPPAATNAPKTDGMAINIGNGTYLLIEGVQLNSGSGTDGQNKNELSYSIKSGKPQQAQIKVHNGKIGAAQYRYSSTANMTINNKIVPLNKLGTYTSAWAKTTATQTAVNIPTLKGISFKKVKEAELKEAVQESLRQRNYKSTAIKAAVNKINKRTQITSAPFSVATTSTAIKLSGTDAKGKAFEKIIKLEY